MENSGLWTGVAVAAEWIARVFWASLLWFVFSLAGAGVLGVGPATASLAALTRKWAQGQGGVHPWAIFWGTFRHDFWRTNRLAWVIMGGGGFLAWDTRLTASVKIHLLHAAVIPLYVVDVMAVAMALYVFPLYAHRQMDRLWQYFRLAALTCVVNPGRTLLILTMLYVVFFVLGGILPLAAVSALMYAMVRLSLAGFKRLERMIAAQSGMPSD